VTIRAVIFDWGGTLTPWHELDLLDTWRSYASAYDAARAEEIALSLHTGEQARWAQQFATRGEIGTGVLEELFLEAGVDTSSSAHAEALQQYFAAWDPHTYTDPEALELLERLRGHGLKTAVLSNTMWPRSHHEYVLARDGVLHLFDYLLFSSEHPTGKPHRSVFSDVLYNLDVAPHEAVFVGDRPFDDIQGAQTVGMKGILIPHTQLPPAHSTDLGVVPDAIAQRLGDVWDIVCGWIHSTA
jgi:putative hydrolase of the HAD superfamily